MIQQSALIGFGDSQSIMVQKLMIVFLMNCLKVSLGFAMSPHFVLSGRHLLISYYHKKGGYSAVRYWVRGDHIHITFIKYVGIITLLFILLLLLNCYCAGFINSTSSQVQEKYRVSRVLYYLWFQASSGSLRIYFPWIRGNFQYFLSY